MDALLEKCRQFGESVIVTGDGLVVAPSARGAASALVSQREAASAALVYRACCTLHGSQRDEYKQQLGGRFLAPEGSIVDQYRHVATAAATAESPSASETASDSASSAAQLAAAQRTGNTNFFSLQADERPAADCICHCRGGLLAIETTERKIECRPLVLPLGKSVETPSDPVELPQILFIVSTA